MATEVIIPSFGTSKVDVRIMRWQKNVGDPVKRGDVLCELETDKATTELESFADGVLLAQVVPADTEVEIGQVIAHIGQPGEEVPDAPAKSAAATPEPKPTPVIQRPNRPAMNIGGGIKASPMIRQLAQQLGVDLTKVKGSGPGGQITRLDVERAAN